MQRGKRILGLLLAAAMLTLCLSSCHGAVCISDLTVTDAGGKGERVCLIYSPAANDEYLTQGQLLVTFLQKKLRAELGRDATDYTIAYEGLFPAAQVGLADSLYEMSDGEREQGYHAFSLRYSFTDIKDYNTKTSRLYRLSQKLIDDRTDDTYRAGVLDDYVDTLLRVTARTDGNGNPTGQFDVTLTETGAVSYGLVAWAMVWLYQNRHDEAMWLTEDVYYAPFSADETHTMFSALKTQVTVSLGETVRTVTPLTGPVIEGQGEVEGIVFNVTGVLGAAEEKESSVFTVILLCGACLLLGAVSVLFISLRVRRYSLHG